MTLPLIGLMCTIVGISTKVIVLLFKSSHYVQEVMAI